MVDIGFTCGLPAGNDNPTNTEANAESPEGTHDPYGGTTYTPRPSTNVAAMGITGLNPLRSTLRSTELDQRRLGELGALRWAVPGALLIYAL